MFFWRFIILCFFLTQYLLNFTLYSFNLSMNLTSLKIEIDIFTKEKIFVKTADLIIYFVL